MTTSILSANIIQSNPRFWTHHRRQILNAVLRNTHDSRLDSTALKSVEDELKSDNRVLPRRLKKSLSAVLEEANLTGYLDAVVPAIPIRIPRPSILPSDISLYSHLEPMGELIDFVKNRWSKKRSSTIEDLWLSFSLMLSTQSGIPKDTVLHTLTSLRYRDILENNILSIPIHAKDNSDKRCYFCISSTARDTLNRILRKSPQIKADSYIFLTEESGYKTRRKKLFNDLNSAYKSLIKDIKYQDTLPTLQIFFTLGPLIAFHAGIEPFLISALRGPILPTCHPVDSKYRVLYSHEATPPTGLIQKRDQRNTRKSLLEDTSLPRSLKAIRTEPADYEIDDWSGRSKLILRQLIRALELKWGRRLPQGQVSDADQIFSRFRDSANSIVDAKSALHLAIDWIQYKFVIERSLTPSSVKTYLDRAFTNGFLNYIDSFDISEWDVEDHDQLIEACLTRDRISEKTRKDIADTFSQVYRFAKKHNYCPHVDVNFISNEWIGGSNRYEIIGLSEFDAFFRILAQKNTREHRIYAVIAILGFYAGLRAGEITMLTLDDIVFDYDYLSIEIKRGKTPAARRRVVLSLLSSPAIFNYVKSYAEDRRAEFSSNNVVLQTIGLFGPVGVRDRYDGRQLINQVIKLLKDWFGQDYVFHSLRHSFASWLLIRWYALRHPDLLSNIREQHHEIFSSLSLNRLAYLFTLEEIDDYPDWIPHDLITISKLFGHSGEQTLFRVYVHTFHILHMHAVSNSKQLCCQSA